VETQHNRGSFVLGLTPKKVVELMQVREALESQAARLATPRFSDDELAALERLFVGYLDGSAASSFETERHLQVMLHHTVARRSGNDELAKAIINYEERYFQYLCNAMRLMNFEVVRGECQEHLGIVRAMQERNPDKAAQRMAQHIQLGAQRYAERLELASKMAK
jgi:DNA-binding GntR family transcriptional regulator